VTGPCPHCGADASEQVEVWEQPEAWVQGADPDYIGCTDCHTMDPVEGHEEPGVGHCDGCGEAIEYGEWHTEDDPEAEDPVLHCRECSERPAEDCPEGTS